MTARTLQLGGVLAAAIVLVACAGASRSPLGTTSTPKGPAQNVAPPTTAAAGGPTIAVVACPTTYGGGQPNPQPAPAPIPVDLPAGTAAQLGFYTTDTYGVAPILAPRAWACTALVAGDGSVGITVFPPHTAAPQAGVTGQPSVVAQSDSACQSCVWGTVCRFVPAASAQLGYTDLTCPAAPAAEKTHWIKGSPQDAPPIADVISFEDPGGLEPTDGLVLYDDHGREGSASEEDCTLPVAQHALCTAILNSFSAQAWLMN